MRSVIYVIVPALSLLNMGVEAATIAKTLTNKHSSDSHQVRKIVHDRQFHNADFGLDSGHVARNGVDDVVAGDAKTTITNNNGTSVDAKGNPDFTKAIFGENANSAAGDLSASEPTVVSGALDSGNTTAGNSDSSESGVISNSSNTSVGSEKISTENSGSPDPGLVSDSSKANVDPGEIPKEDSLLSSMGTGEVGSTAASPLEKMSGAFQQLSSYLTSVTQPLENGSVLSSLGSVFPSENPIPSVLGTGMTGLTGDNVKVDYERRQDAETMDGDGTEDISTVELEPMSSSLDNVSSLKSNMIAPQGFERRMIKMSRNINATIGGQELLNQKIPSTISTLNQRDTTDGLPAPIPSLPVDLPVGLTRQVDTTDGELGEDGDVAEPSSIADID